MAEEYRIWMMRAESSLALGLVQKSEHIYYEDLCFQLQQAAEKALKAFLIYHGIEPPITHSLVLLLRKVRQVTDYPEELERVIELEDYAVQTRYPGEYAPVEEEEYNRASQIASYTVSWIREQIL